MLFFGGLVRAFFDARSVDECGAPEGIGQFVLWHCVGATDTEQIASCCNSHVKAARRYYYYIAYYVAY